MPNKDNEFHAACNSAAALARSYQNGSALMAANRDLLTAYRAIDGALTQIRNRASEGRLPPPHEHMRRVASMVVHTLHTCHMKLGIGGHTPERLVDYLERQKEVLADLTLLQETRVGDVRLVELRAFLELLGRGASALREEKVFPAHTGCFKP